MQRVLLAPRAVLLDLHAIRHVGLVLGGRVITTLAISASQGNHSAHVSKPPFTAPTGTVANITIDHHVMSMPTVLPYLFCKGDSQLERNSEEGKRSRAAQIREYHLAKPITIVKAGRKRTRHQLRRRVLQVRLDQRVTEVTR